MTANSLATMKSSSDEYYTPLVVVEPIIEKVVRWSQKFKKSFKKDPIVWCPFDKENSEFVIGFKSIGLKVINSHIDEGKDFFKYTPDFDIAVSNPPFSVKLEVFKRLDELKKPWAMLMNIMILNYNEINDYFADNGGLQLLILTKKMTFDGGKVPFNSSYFCRRLLERDIEYGKLEHDNTGPRFIPSRMSQRSFGFSFSGVQSN